MSLLWLKIPTFFTVYSGPSIIQTHLALSGSVDLKVQSLANLL